MAKLSFDDKRRVNNRIVDLTGVLYEAVTPFTKFDDDLGLDSLDILEITMEVEQEFGIRISEEEVEKIETVDDLYTAVENNRSDSDER